MRMTNWTIKKGITGGFACVIFIALALGVFAYMRFIAVKGHSDRITEVQFPAIERVYRAQENAKDAEQVIYKIIGSSDKEDRERLEAALKADSADNVVVYGDLERLITDAASRELMEKVKASRAAYIQSREQVLAASRQSADKAAVYALARSQLDAATDRYLDSLGALIDHVKGDSDRASSDIQSAVQGSLTAILVGLVMVFVAGIGLGILIIWGTCKVLNGVANDLSKGIKQVNSTSGQVSDASQTLAKDANEQAASLEETSSSLEEMDSMTKRNSENAEKADELAKQARSAAERGVVDMQSMSSAMEAIKVSSDDIAKIIKTIDEIAFQTNILALNAAVEAARAGEAGMGFAVVADEVRNLAQRSAQAAKETAAKIEGAIAKSGQGVEISVKVSGTLNEILTKIRGVDELVTEVSGASREQAQGISQINTAIRQMDKVTQSNAASAEESASAAAEMNSQADHILESVGVLLRFVGAGSTAVAGYSAHDAGIGNADANGASDGPTDFGRGEGNDHVKAARLFDSPRSRANGMPAGESNNGFSAPGRF